MEAIPKTHKPGTQDDTGVAIAEKTETSTQLTIFKATRGFDPEKWVKTKPKIRGEADIEPEYESIDLVQHTHQRET